MFWPNFPPHEFASSLWRYAYLFSLKHTCPPGPDIFVILYYVSISHDRKWKCYNSRSYVNIRIGNSSECSTYFSSGGGGISCIGVEIGVFSISIIAKGASGSGRGETALSIDAPSPAAGSVAFPALLPNLRLFTKLIHLKIGCRSFSQNNLQLFCVRIGYDRNLISKQG